MQNCVRRNVRAQSSRGFETLTLKSQQSLLLLTCPDCGRSARGIATKARPSKNGAIRTLPGLARQSKPNYYSSEPHAYPANRLHGTRRYLSSGAGLYAPETGYRQPRRRSRTTPWKSLNEKEAPSNIAEAHRLLHRALLTKTSSGLRLALSRALKVRGAIQSLPPTTFAEVLGNLEGTDEYSPFRPLYATTMQPSYHIAHKAHLILYERIRNLRQIVAAVWCERFADGIKPKLLEHVSRFKFARDVYDGEGAMAAMEDMQSNGIQPNLSCYNYYLEALVWINAWYPHARVRLRNIPLDVPIMPASRIPQTYITYNLTLQSYRNDGSLTFLATGVFEEMMSAGIGPNTDTYCHLIMALARDAYMDRIGRLLQQVWKVQDISDAPIASHCNVPPLLENDPQLYPDTEDQDPIFEPDHPLYPDTKLLFAIAHAYCTNNRLLKGIRLVRLMANRYSLPITDKIWNEFMQRAFQLSDHRSPRQRRYNKQAGRVARKYVKLLYQLATSDRYKCKPSLPMFDRLASSFLHARRIWPFLQCLVHVVQLYLDQEWQYRTLRRAAFDRLAHQKLRELGNSRLFAYFFARAWLRRLLHSTKYWLWKDNLPNSKGYVAWQVTFVPDFIDLFCSCLDIGRDPLVYNIATGTIHLKEIKSLSNGSGTLGEDSLVSMSQ